MRAGLAVRLLMSGLMVSIVAGFPALQEGGSSLALPRVHAEPAAEASKKPEKKSPPPPPVSLTMKPLKNIYSPREGLGVQFVFHAIRPTRLCLEKDPFTQFQFNVERGGVGKLPLAPIVVKDTRELFFQPIKVVNLQPGKPYYLRGNLKRLNFTDGQDWGIGDYYVSATFFLCNQEEDEETFDSAGEEIPIKSAKTATFMIME